jgi:CheY-like chemotaxis protein
MSGPHKNHILVVDDERSVRETFVMLLSSAGYDVSSAEDGFAALLQMKRKLPKLIVSDLNMPHMSGFELLSVVRRRFPQVSVVAMSGAYEGEALPGGVIADAFYAKGWHSPETFLKTVHDLIQTSASRAKVHAKASAPVWIPRNGKDSTGTPYIVVTCTQCLRSFPVNVAEEAASVVRETSCVFCPNEVEYIIDFSVSVSSPPKSAGMAAAMPGTGKVA